MARAIIYSEGSTEEEKKRVVEDVKNFINNARIARKNDEKVLDWKRKLLQELELVEEVTVLREKLMNEQEQKKICSMDRERDKRQ